MKMLAFKTKQNIKKKKKKKKRGPAFRSPKVAMVKCGIKYYM